MTKITVIGAGSASFGLSTLGALLQKPELRGSELALVDTHAEGLEMITRLAEKVNREWGSGFTIRSSTRRRDLLEESDFVITAVAVDREKTWSMDRELGKKYGINHYAENGGPGGLMHTARNAAQFMPILEDLQELAPGALLLNFTNPVPRICRLAHHYYGIRTVGICHQITFGYMQVGFVLADVLGLQVPENYSFTWEDEFAHGRTYAVGRAAAEKVRITAAGINHFTWILSLTDRRTGEDLYPLFRERLEKHHPAFEPFSRELWRVFGLYPVSGDNHLVEYLPYTHNMHRETWERYNIQMYPLVLASSVREEMWQRIREMVEGKRPVEELRRLPSERAEEIIAAMAGEGKGYEEAVNIPNNGFIANLPDDSIVEVPAVVDASGIHGERVGELPPAIAELCRREIALAELTTEAVYHGDRELALQALALDPMIDDLGVARKMLEEFLETQREYVPQFF